MLSAEIVKEEDIDESKNEFVCGSGDIDGGRS
jgi:hypothetical protein